MCPTLGLSCFTGEEAEGAGEVSLGVVGLDVGVGSVSDSREETKFSYRLGT